MALYGKKLHIRKNGVVTDINLWTEIAEAGTPALHIRDGVNLVHAQLGAVTDGLASDLRVRKDNVVYAVLKNRYVMMNIIQSPNQTIIVTVNGVEHTSIIGIPYGSSFSVRVVAAAGFNPRAPSMASRVATSDFTISATPATQAGPATGTIRGHGVLNLTIPSGATVILISCERDSYYVGVTSGVPYQIKDYDLLADNGTVGTNTYIFNKNTNGELFLADILPEGDITDEVPNWFDVHWSAAINAHGPTNGSV